MPSERGRSNKSRAETVSSSEDTESSPSPPPPPRRTPERVNNHGTLQDRYRSAGSILRRQHVERLGPPRPRPSNSGRQMTMLDLNREVRQLERARRQQPESFGRMPAAVAPTSAPAHGSASPSRRTWPIPTLEEAINMVAEQRRVAHRQRQERRDQRARAEAANILTYENARTMLRV